ncbi:hypothetical protein GDO78_015562 [Eleutherodactylus coqui]|uniref:Reticulon n=1 Tax=Eleutherodactylus coqui TaxID=57060 RepID=A0A8J6B289_ELECQ|nr:hypothetical protein GDO78_015562 [Eleutherodactylus coqui]
MLTLSLHSALMLRLSPLSLSLLVADLLYWRDITLSAGCLTGLTLCLLALIQFSVISIISYACLLILSAAFTLRLYYRVLKKGDGGNPFQKYLDVDPILPPQQVEVYSSRLVVLIFSALSTLRRLFLVQDTKESLKFLLLLYLLTYVGAVVNGLTLLLLGKTLTSLPYTLLGCEERGAE